MRAVRVLLVGCVITTVAACGNDDIPDGVTSSQIVAAAGNDTAEEELCATIAGSLDEIGSVFGWVEPDFDGSTVEVDAAGVRFWCSYNEFGDSDDSVSIEMRFFEPVSNDNQWTVGPSPDDGTDNPRTSMVNPGIGADIVIRSEKGPDALARGWDQQIFDGVAGWDGFGGVDPANFVPATVAPDNTEAPDSTDGVEEAAPTTIFVDPFTELSDASRTAMQACFAEMRSAPVARADATVLDDRSGVNALRDECAEAVRLIAVDNLDPDDQSPLSRLSTALTVVVTIADTALAALDAGTPETIKVSTFDRPIRDAAANIDAVLTGSD